MEDSVGGAQRDRQSQQTAHDQRYPKSQAMTALLGLDRLVQALVVLLAGQRLRLGLQHLCLVFAHRLIPPCRIISHPILREELDDEQNCE
ncbi:hypothetical protein [Saccharopolyspora hattusasensis]|uniref:hypothetical protein n=1 Tax=Saccharopolyspora hattusasensis TaxID=1128679 RepID=UPI003D96A97B